MNQETLYKLATFYDAIMETNYKYGNQNSGYLKWITILLAILIVLILIFIYLYYQKNYNSRDPKNKQENFVQQRLPTNYYYQNPQNSYPQLPYYSYSQGKLFNKVPTIEEIY